MACSPGLAGSSRLPDQAAEGHADRCVPAKASQRHATEHGIADLIVVGRVCQLQLFQQFAGEVMGGLIISSAIGALCCLVGLLEIAVQVGELMVLLCNRALVLFKR